MTLATCFWALMLIWLIFGFWAGFPITNIGGNLLLFVLLCILGYKCFDFRK